MSFSWTTFALQAVNFLILVWLLKRFVFRPVRAALDQRKLEMARAQADVQSARDHAEAARKDFETRQMQLEAQRQALADQSRAQMAEERSRMIEEARAEIGRQSTAAQKLLQEERERAARELSERTVRLALQIAQTLLRQIASSGLDQLFLDRVVEHLDSLPEAERNALLTQLARDAGQLTVTTASPLQATAQSQWRAALNPRLGGSPRISFATDAALIAGVELNFPHAVLRFSWSSALTQAQRELIRDEQAG
jgi:F-type H+-transporting ATPase subunit b